MQNGTKEASAQPDETVIVKSSVQLTTALVQQYLDENQVLIQAIVEHQNSGNLEESCKYQRRLLENLTYLATISDICSSQH